MASRRGFEIAIICALPLEAHAVKALFEAQLTDEENVNCDYGSNSVANFSKSRGDQNAYTTGRISHHDVVLVHMPGIGEIPAAAVAADLRRSFEEIKLALVVGICGGVPGNVHGNPDESFRKLMLGDVVIGKQVIQYDFGRQYPEGFKRKNDLENSLSRQNPEIRSFVAKLESKREELEQQLWEYIRSTFKFKPNEGSSAAGPLHELRDELMPPTYWHKHRNLDDCSDKKCQDDHGVCEEARSASCEQLKCDTNQPFTLRRGKPKRKPDIHFGTIASGNTVMKSGEVRDQLVAKENQNVIAFDMEGAGIWDYLPCVIVKGVCDYADSHKNKIWQGYASMTAAACAKVVLEQWPKKNPQQSLEDQASFHSYAPKTRILLFCAAE
ncbi:hypothetical protein EMPG_12182 [Blastomyces silverae]|uniref:Nucleoside phosphorylase domain-containing protein n=1 Tax=Blastomyces silverae TaxID=2060906 RepID=A0A0H1BNB6_9EURO|nr:hypothetical protein EMPG_12182 [Blastomyces silverae]